MESVPLRINLNYLEALVNFLLFHILVPTFASRSWWAPTSGHHDLVAVHFCTECLWSEN